MKQDELVCYLLKKHSEFDKRLHRVVVTNDKALTDLAYAVNINSIQLEFIIEYLKISKEKLHEYTLKKLQNIQSGKGGELNAEVSNDKDKNG